MTDALMSPAGGDELQEENWRLLQRLQYVEVNHRQLQRHNRALQQHVRRLEALLAEHNEHKNQRDDKAKCDHKWMEEHDSTVRALLRIIQYHETVNEELQREMELLQTKEATASAVMVSRSAQTDIKSERSVFQDCMGTQSIHLGTSSPIKRLNDLLQQSRKDPIRDRSTTAPGRPTWCATPNSHSDFRSTVIKRLRQSQAYHRPGFRPLPTLEEVNEDEDSAAKEDGKKHSSATNHAEVRTAESPRPLSGLMRQYQDVVEQNQRLQERLESQQSLLDQLLSIKLDQVSRPPKNTDSDCDARSSPAKHNGPLRFAGESSVASSVSAKCDGGTGDQDCNLSSVANLQLDMSSVSTTSRSASNSARPMSPPAA